MQPTEDEQAFMAPRRCLREPFDEIAEAAAVLDRAVDAHLNGNPHAAEVLIVQANMPGVRAWTESLWGSRAANPDQWRYLRVRPVSDAAPWLPKNERVPVRMPTANEKASIIAHYGRSCTFCGIPLIRAEVRREFCRLYPQLNIWGSTNVSQHAAFQCMWMQFDHILPHSRGGDNSIKNVVVTCAPCNFARMDLTLKEVGLIDPRSVQPNQTSWDGLERILTSMR